MQSLMHVLKHMNSLIDFSGATFVFKLKNACVQNQGLSVHQLVNMLISTCI